MPRFGARKPKLNNEMFIKMRLNGGKGQMADLIQDDSESVGDDGDYFDPNAGQENTFGNNVKAWDGRGGKMPTFTRGTPVSFFSVSIEYILPCYSLATPYAEAIWSRN